MRGRLLFALAFACGLWALLRLFTAEQAEAALPFPAARVAAPAALAEDGDAEGAAAPRATARAEEQRFALPRPMPRRAAPPLNLPYYRAAWQAFHLEGRAG